MTARQRMLECTITYIMSTAICHAFTRVCIHAYEFARAHASECKHALLRMFAGISVGVEAMVGVTFPFRVVY